MVMRIKITSNGTWHGTRIVNAETGEVIEGVMTAAWEVTDPTELARVTLEVTGVEVELEGETHAG